MHPHMNSALLNPNSDLSEATSDEVCHAGRSEAAGVEYSRFNVERPYRCQTYTNFIWARMPHPDPS